MSFGGLKSIFQLKEEEIRLPTINESIRDVCRKMENAYDRFEFESDPDLIEASIYEIESLKARYRYLLKRAKQQGLTCPANSGLFSRKEESPLRHL